MNPSTEKPIDPKHLSNATTLADFTFTPSKTQTVTVSEKSTSLNGDNQKDIEAGETEDTLPQWKPQKSEWLIMITLSLMSLMVALDATILVSVLPVSVLISVTGYR
jgi:hypothetical protein